MPDQMTLSAQERSYVDGLCNRAAVLLGIDPEEVGIVGQSKLISLRPVDLQRLLEMAEAGR